MKEEDIPISEWPPNSSDLWEARFKKLQDGRGIVLYPDTPEKIKALRRNVYGAARRRHIAIKTTVVTSGNIIRLFVKLA